MEQLQPESNHNEQEILASHEQFFVKNVGIKTHKIFCGDERKPLFEGVFIHVFGGLANTAFNAEALSRATGKGRRLASFKNAVSSCAKAFKSRDVPAGLHSDTHSETGPAINLASTDEIGCGYIKLRRTISQKIAENPDKIVAEAQRLRPELFTDPSDTSFGHAIVDSHAQLTADDEFFAEGSREVAGAAVEEGAPTMLVDGDHTAKLGIINLRKDTTIDSGAAFEQAKSIYVHDSWASHEMAENYENAHDFTSKEWQIADLIDAIGTMWALGVEEIVVRR